MNVLSKDMAMAYLGYHMFHVLGCDIKCVFHIWHVSDIVVGMLPSAFQFVVPLKLLVFVLYTVRDHSF